MKKITGHPLNRFIFAVMLVLLAAIMMTFGGFTQANAQPNEVWVDDDYCDGCPNDGHTWGYDAFDKIQDGINAVTSPGTVKVNAGTYVENVDFLGKAITVTSEGGPATTIIDGDNGPPVVKFVSGEERDSVLTGFTVQNAFTSLEGGGIQIKNSSPTIIDNIIRDNRTTGMGGGGIGIENGSPLIQGNLITNNLADGPGRGGGINIIGGSAEIINNTISNNTVDTVGGGGGGGIYIDILSGGLIRDNVIIGNTAMNGGGIYIRDALFSKIVQNLIIGNSAISVDFLFPSRGGGICLERPSTKYQVFVNNTIADNHADLGSAFYSDGFNSEVVLINNNVIGAEGEIAFFCGQLGFNTPVLKFNNVFSPMADAYGANCIDPTGSNGNISLDPLFVDFKNGDYHLTSGSPCIDAGTNSAPDLPDTDFEGGPRILDGDNDGTATVDMGVYEYVIPDETPPIVEHTGTNPGPPKSYEVTCQDKESGLAEINVVAAKNFTVDIPPFDVGTNDPVILTVTKVDQSKSSFFDVEVIDVAGNVTRFDPEDDPETGELKSSGGSSSILGCFIDTVAYGFRRAR
jgi:hypothetical protein